MPRRKTDDEDAPVGDSPQARLVGYLSKDKNVAGGVHTAGGSLLSDMPFFISTQSAFLDYTIGQLGVPGGRLTTWIGREGSGKSTVTQHLLVETQQMGGIGILVDSEQRFSRERFTCMGGRPEDLIVIEGLSMEKSFEAIEKTCIFLRDEEKLPRELPITVVYDSLAGSPTEKVLEADVSQTVMAQAARFVSRELPRLKMEIAAKRGVCLNIVNQLRSYIDANSDPRQRNNERRKVMGRESMLAEASLVYESSLVIRANMVAHIGEDNAKPEGIRSRFTMRKNGLGPKEGHRCEVDINFLTGFNRIDSKFELLEEVELITGGAGGRYSFSEELKALVGGGPEKSFYQKNFAEILLDYPALEDVLRSLPTKWKEG